MENNKWPEKYAVNSTARVPLQKRARVVFTAGLSFPIWTT